MLKKFFEGHKFHLDIAAILSGAIFIFCWVKFASSPLNGTFLSNGANANLVMFVVFAVLFVVCFGMAALLSMLLPANIKEKNEKVVKVLDGMLLLFIGGCLVWQFFSEQMLEPRGTASIYLRHNVPWILYFLLVAIVAYFVIVKCKGIVIQRKERILIALLLAGVVAVCQYCPNGFYDMGGWLYHYDAYVNSIFNTVNGHAFSDVNISIYGHYGLLYAPLVTVLGGGTYGVARAISVVVFVTMFAIEAAVAKLIKKDNIYLLTALALPAGTVMIYVNGLYNQIVPHRWLFPALLICYVSFLNWNQKQTWKQVIVVATGWLVCVLSIIWNTETGLFCSIGYSAFLFYLYLEKQSRFRIHIIGKFLLIAIGDVVAFLVAYGIVNLYNIIAGGSTISVSTYIYPMLADEYNINELLMAAPHGVSTYIFEMLVFLVVGCGMFGLLKSKDISVEKRGCMLMTALIGMAAFTYYINRSAYCNISISYLQAVLLTGVMAEILWEKWKKQHRWLYGGVSLLSSIVLVALAIGTVTYAGVNMDRKRTSTWNGDDLIEQSQALSMVVPEDTFAFGKGIWLVYGVMHWDTGCATIDFEDMNQEALEYIAEQVENQDSFLAERDSLNTVLSATDLDISDFELQQSFGVCNSGYDYYVKK